ncbi:MAG TPA: DUF1579 domain-containing protein, partial [Gemmatimonadales bacterium]|nr:DUF1579 domain-containing protein [Gemmatimonadales bacterium]
VKAYMKPGASPEESKGSAVYTMISDGRFLRSEFKGQMMGMPFTGTGLDGYDRVRGAYVATWMDSMSTGLMFETGVSKDEGKTIEYTGEVGDCMAPGKTVKVRTVVTHTSDDAFTYAMYQTRAGEKEAQCLEITYTRAKGK